MTLPSPFDPFAFTTGILANLATDMLKHHAQSLENTLAGRMLKRAGLIEPNFDDRLRDTIAQTLQFYFETHPAYRLTGVAAFFRDPITATQIGDFILERKQIDQDEIQKALETHLGTEPIAHIPIQQRGLNPKVIVPNFLECYRRTLSKQLSVPQMALLLEILDQTDTMIHEMRASEGRLKAVVQEVINRVDSQMGLLESISSDMQVFKQKLGLDRPPTVIAEEINLTLRTVTRSSMFDSGGWCSGYQFNPMPDRYFLAQAFTPDRDDLRSALSKALNEFGVTPVVGDDIFWHGYFICKISALIQSTPFGIYQLTKNQNRNVHLELGIAIGLGRPFILVKDRDAEVSPMIQGIEYFPIESYLELSSKLGARIRPFLTEIGKYKLPQLDAPGSSKTVIISHGNVEAVDYCVTIARTLVKFNLTPVILGDPEGKIAEFLAQERIPHSVAGSGGTKMLDEVVSAIQQARLGVYRIEKDCSPDAFVALGISMGLNRPGILVQKRNREIPADLAGAVKLEFDAYSKFETPLIDRYGDFIKRYAV